MRDGPGAGRARRGRRLFGRAELGKPLKANVRLISLGGMRVYVSLKDVAAHAGVSFQTAGKVPTPTPTARAWSAR
jgi:hypothetical protein